MNEFLAQYFGTNATPDMIEEQTKQAEAETFVQLAKEAGVPLHEMTDAQIAELYENVMGKTASDDGDEDDEEKKRKAAEEYASKKESHVKFAEATEMGQIMAHSFWNELGEIEKEAGLKERASDLWGRAKGLPKRLAEYSAAHRSAAEEARGALSGARSQEATEAFKALKKDPTRVKELAQHMGAKKELKRKALGHLVRGQAERAAKGGLAAGGLAAAGGVGYTAGREKESAAALNELALELAVEKCASAGWDADEAASRIVSVINLDLVDDDNTKIAYANDVDGAIEIRSLELIEAAGYPVTWE
jgi:hypothetical protein